MLMYLSAILEMFTTNVLLLLNKTFLSSLFNNTRLFVVMSKTQKTGLHDKKLSIIYSQLSRCIFYVIQWFISSFVFFILIAKVS